MISFVVVSSSPRGQLYGLFQRGHYGRMERDSVGRELRRTRRHAQQPPRTEQLHDLVVDIGDVRGLLALRRAGSRARQQHDGGGDRWHADEDVQLRRFRLNTTV